MHGYAGSTVLIQLKEGYNVTGAIVELHEATRCLELQCVTVHHPDGRTKDLPSASITIDKIQNIDFVSLPVLTAGGSVPHVSDVSGVSGVSGASMSIPMPAPTTPTVPIVSTRKEFVDPAIVSMGSMMSVYPEPSIPQEPEAQKPTPENTVPQREEAPKKPEQAAPSPSTLPKQPLFGNVTPKSKKRVLETVVFSDYRHFVRSRGKNGKRATEEEVAELSKKMPANEKADALQEEAEKTDAVDTQATATLMASLRLSTPTPSQNKENKTSTSTSTITSSSTTTTTTIKVPASLVPPKARTRGSFQGYSPVKEGILASKSGPHTSKEASPNPKNMSPIFKQGSSHTHTPSVGTSDSSNVSPNVSPNVNVNSPTHTNPSPTVPPVAVSSPLSHNAYPNTLTHTLPVQSESTEQGPLIKTVAGGVLCPVITPEKMKEMETLCVSNLGPSEKMIIENAGYGASMMALKAIGGQRRIQPNNHNAAPLIVVLAGNNRVGSYSLAAARHLANRSCHVVLFLASDSGTLGKDVEEQKTYAESAGVKIVKSVDHLPWPSTSPVDLIIDALMGCQCTLMDLRRNYSTLQLIWSGMEWANNNKAPVLSIDFPSGVNPADGHPFHIMHYIRPKWTLCFGAPKMGCISRNITGELFLADIGIPSAAWPRVNGLAFNIPWGADFVLALEYQT